jgi:hypothetical protein
MVKGLNECLGWGRDCKHGEQLHATFDEGVVAAWTGADTGNDPYGDSLLKEAWLTGHHEGLRAQKEELCSTRENRRNAGS